MVWCFSTMAYTDGLVLWHLGNSWHSAEYAPMNFQVLRGQRKGWKCAIEVTFNVNANNFMIYKNFSLIGNYLIQLNVWLLHYFQTWNTIISCRMALSWQAWHSSSDAVLLDSKVPVLSLLSTCLYSHDRIFTVSLDTADRMILLATALIHNHFWLLHPPMVPSSQLGGLESPARAKPPAQSNTTNDQWHHWYSNPGSGRSYI